MGSVEGSGPPSWERAAAQLTERCRAGEWAGCYLPTHGRLAQLLHVHTATIGRRVMPALVARGVLVRDEHGWYPAGGTPPAPQRPRDVAAARLRERVQRLRPGDRLPAGAVLRREHRVGAVALAGALSLLEEEGLVQRDALGAWRRVTTAGSLVPVLRRAHVDPWLLLWRAEAGPGSVWLGVLEAACAWLLRQPPGTPMRSAKALAADVGVDRSTIRFQVVRRLATAGLIVRRGTGPHSGWVTAEVPPPPFGSIERRRHWRLAIEPLARICRVWMVPGQLLPANDRLAALLRIPEGAVYGSVLPELARRGVVVSERRDRHARSRWRTTGGAPVGEQRVRAVVDNLLGRVRALSPGELLPNVAQLADEYGMPNVTYLELVLPALVEAQLVERADVPGGWRRTAAPAGPPPLAAGTVPAADRNGRKSR